MGVVKGGVARGTRGKVPWQERFYREVPISQQCFLCLRVFESTGDFVKMEVVI